MIAIRSVVGNSNRAAILYTYERDPEQILAAAIRLSVLRTSLFPGQRIYLEIDGREIPEERCAKLEAAMENRSSAETLNTLACEILDYHP